MMMRFISFLLLFCGSSLYAFTPGNEGRRTIDIEPRFVSLELDEEVYKGKIIDEQNSFNVKNISFGGITKILGVKTDNDDSNNILKLSQIKSIKILDPHYRSPRHTTNDNMFFFVKVQVVHNTANEVTETVLIPHNVILCAEDSTTGTEKAWRLRDINELIVYHSAGGQEINRSPDGDSRSRSSRLPMAQDPSERSFAQKVWHNTIDGIQYGVKKIRNWLNKGL